MKFKKVKLGEVSDIIPGYAFKSKDFSQDGPKVVKITDIVPPIVNLNNTCRVNISNYNVKKLEKYKVNQGDFIIAMTGTTIGKIGKIINNESAYLNQRTAKFMPIDGVHKKFLYYALMQKDFIQFVINHIDSESAQPNISASTLAQYKFNLPNYKAQQKIGEFLNILDKKIELNNQINDNLQNIILSIFNKFLADNSNFNETTIKDAVKKIGTGADAIQRAPIVEYDTGIRCIRVGDMTNSRTKYQWGFTKMTEKDFKNYKLNVGDIIVTRTAVNGLSYLIEDNMKVVCNNGLIRMSVNNKYHPLYIFLCLQTKDFYNYVHRIDAETSVRPNMKVNFFTSYKIREIPIEKQNEICEKLIPLRNKQQTIIIENEKLSNLRDTLLPKLMNGEIDLDKIKI